MKRFKKLTAGFLGVVMALGVCSFTALAEEYVAQIGNDKYTDFSLAVSEADSGDTIVLLDDASINSLGSPIDKNITYTLTKQFTNRNNCVILWIDTKAA